MFRSSAALAADVRHKILAYGPSHVGKTHLIVTAPAPAIVEPENRLSLFAARGFDFQAAAAASLDDVREAFRAIKAGQVPCETIGIDSISAVYAQLIDQFTRRSEKGAAITDYVSVNRLMKAFIAFISAISGKHLIATAHAAEKLERRGNDFDRKGQHFVGPDELKYAFDWVLHYQARGHVVVEKSGAPTLPVGTVIRGDLDFPRFLALVDGREKPQGGAKPAPAPAARPESDPIDQDFPGQGGAPQRAAQPVAATPPPEAARPARTPTTEALDHALSALSEEQRHRIGDLARERRMSAARLLLHARNIAGGMQAVLHPAKFPLLIDAVEHEQPSRVAS